MPEKAPQTMTIATKQMTHCFKSTKMTTRTPILSYCS